MRDDKDHNERLDDFSGYMRQRLEEHRLPVDAGGWDEVEARMNRRARSRGWLWTRGLAAAAVLALVIWLLPSPEKMPLEELSPFQKEISEKAEEMNILPEHPVLPVEPVKKRIAKVLKWEKKAKLSAIVGEKETIREDEKCETIEIIEKDAIAAIVEEPSAKEDASEDSATLSFSAISALVFPSQSRRRVSISRSDSSQESVLPSRTLGTLSGQKRLPERVPSITPTRSPEGESLYQKLSAPIFLARSRNRPSSIEVTITIFIPG